MKRAAEKLCTKGDETNKMDGFEALVSAVDTEINGLLTGQENCSDNEHKNLHAFLLKVFAEFRILRKRSDELGAVHSFQRLLQKII